MLKQNKIKNPKIEIIKSGQLINVKYIIIKNDEIRILNFIGLCVLKKKKNLTLSLKNLIKREVVSLIINLQSPIILKVNIINKYKKKYRLNKLYYK
jgi:ribosomal protein L19